MELEELISQYAKKGFTLEQRNNFYIVRSNQQVMAREPVGSTKLKEVLESLQHIPQMALNAQSPRAKALSNLRQRLHLSADTLNNWSRQRQSIVFANTTLSLFLNNYKRTGADSYRSQGYTISLIDRDKYSVSDSQGRLLLNFQASQRGVKQILENNLSSFHLSDITRARMAINKYGVEAVISTSPKQRIAQLGRLAPQSDRELREAISTQQAANTVKSFLNYMGVSSWSASNGNYSYHLDTNGDLTIASRDGRGDIFKSVNGSVNSKLTDRDFLYFADLQQELKLVVPTKEVAKNSQLASTRELGAFSDVKEMMATLGIKRYQDSYYSFLQQGDKVAISLANGRELARLENGKVTGKLSDWDISYLQDLTQAVNDGVRQSAHLER